MSTSYKESLPYDPAHQIIIKLLNPTGDPDLNPVNIYKLAGHLAIPVATFWRYYCGEARWPASVWLTTMAYLECSGRPVNWSEVSQVFIQIYELQKTNELKSVNETGIAPVEN